MYKVLYQTQDGDIITFMEGLDVMMADEIAKNLIEHYSAVYTAWSEEM